jgi:putative transposase
MRVVGQLRPESARGVATLRAYPASGGSGQIGYRRLLTDPTPRQESSMRTHPWEVDDALWARVQPLIPPPLPSLRGGRARVDDRRAFGAILYVLRTGCQWNALPKELCSSSTAHRRFQEWEAGGFFRALWEAGLTQYDELRGIEWEWQAVDGAMTKSLSGAPRPGPTRLIAARRGPSGAC